MLKRVLLFICLSLFLAGCSSTPQQRPLYSGTNGIILSFPQQNNFQQFPSDVFTIAIRLENDGATDIVGRNQGWITAVFDPATITFMEADVQNQRVFSVRDFPANPFINFTAAGRARDMPSGEVQYAEFTFQARNLTGNRDKAAAPITFQACYPYNTTFIKNVCIDRDYYNTQSTKPCLASTVTDQSQGAPIAVTSVEPRYTRQSTNGNTVIQPQFRIHLTNLAGGYVLWSQTNSNSRDMCTLSDFQRQEFGKVYVDAKLNNVPLKCGTNDNGIATFEGTNAEIACRLETPISLGSNYETPLIVQVKYFYISSLQADVQVAR